MESRGIFLLLFPFEKAEKCAVDEEMFLIKVLPFSHNKGRKVLKRASLRGGSLYFIGEFF